MKRREFFCALVVLPAAVALPARAQQSATMPRLGYLSLRPGPSEFEVAFAQGLREFGYVEGRNVVIEYRYANFDSERLRAMAADLVDRRIDMIIAEAGAAASKQLTSTIPIVLPVGGDPVAQGLVESLARPGGTITGLSVIAPELSRKRLDMFKEAFPGLQRVGALHNETVSMRLQLQESAAAGNALGMTIVPLPLPFPGGIEEGFAKAVRQKFQGIVILSDTATITYRAQLGAAALAHRLPTMFANKLYLTGGGLMSYGPDILATIRRSAYYVDRILKGAKPADLPIELPTKFELAINLKTAKALGLTIPPSLLLRADEVIQ
jgi:putative ABC transport system substrate-binding protein